MVMLSLPKHLARIVASAKGLTTRARGFGFVALRLAGQYLYNGSTRDDSIALSVKDYYSNVSI